MSGLLSEEVLSHIGRQSEPRREIVTRRDIRKYAVATDNRQSKYLSGDVAPPLFHLHLFWDVVPLNELSPDGVSIDSLLPKFPLEKAMAGGLDITYHKPIKPGDWLTATRTLTDIYEKAGRSGPLIFYEVLMEVRDDNDALVITEKDHEDSAMSPAPAVGMSIPARQHVCDEVQQMLYNASLWNGHRIHFDRPYATEVEGYPGLVVAGPLMGDWLHQVVDEWLGESGMITGIEYSNRIAAYVGETVTAGGTVTAYDDNTGEVTLEVFVKNARDEVLAPGVITAKLHRSD